MRHIKPELLLIINTLLEYDVTRRDPLSVVMDAGSGIVNFIRDGTAFGITLKYTTLVSMRSGSAWTGIDDNGAEVTNGLQLAYSNVK